MKLVTNTNINVQITGSMKWKLLASESEIQEVINKCWILILAEGNQNITHPKKKKPKNVSIWHTSFLF